MRLIDKPRNEQFEVWKKRLKHAKELHKEKVMDWADKVLKDYSGETKGNEDRGDRFNSIAQIVIAVEESIQPQLMYQNPSIFAVANAPQWEKREPLVSAVINQEYNDMKPSGATLELENELTILDARLFGYGCTKTTWQVEGGIVEEEPEQDVMESIGSLVTGKKPEMIQTPVIEKEIGHVTEHVSSLDVLLDYSATHISKGKFVIHVLDLPKDKLYQSRYDQEAIEKLKPSSVLLPGTKEYSKSELEKLMNDPDCKAFRLYEIEDLENRVIHTLADGYDDFIEFGTPHPMAEGSQFSFLWFIEIPKQVYPKSPLAYYRERAKEFSYIYSQVSDQIDRFMPKIGIDVNRLSQPAKERLKNGSLGAIVDFDGPPQGAWDLIQPQVNTDLFKYLAMTKELLNLEAGVSDLELLSPEADRTATETNRVANSAKGRKSKPQKRVKQFITGQAHKIWQVIAANQSEEKFIKILGKDDAEEWWNDPETGKNTWTMEDIAGDFAFTLDIESLLPMDKRAREERNNLSMTTLLNPEVRQGMLAEGKELLISGAVEKYAKENMGIKDKSKIMRDLQFLEPGDEHTLWMQGQFPQINEREQKDPQFLLKHFKEHQSFMNSPGFNFLPVEIKEGIIGHIESYVPLIQRTKPAGGGQAPSQSSPSEVREPEAPAGPGMEPNGGVYE